MTEQDFYYTIEQPSVAEFKERGSRFIAHSFPIATADDFKKIEDNLASHYSTKVKLVHNKKGYGSITFEYYSIQELNALLDKLNIKVS